MFTFYVYVLSDVVYCVVQCRARIKNWLRLCTRLQRLDAGMPKYRALRVKHGVLQVQTGTLHILLIVCYNTVRSCLMLVIVPALHSKLYKCVLSISDMCTWCR
jgi:hypothetical protein